MRAEQVFARSAVEALRSGVPSRHAVEQLGTTQDHIKSAFESRIDALAAGEGVEPLVISANFGGGKSHLLNYLKNLAANRGCVTSFAVVSPEMPPGNPHVVLKAIAEAAEAPGRTGRALRELATDLKPNSQAYSDLRIWACDARIDDRFQAMLLLFEELRADEEFRTQVLGDIEGNAIQISQMRQKLKELGEAGNYLLKAKRTSLLAHDRIRLLARFYQTCGATGWVILFDEVDRLATFPARQRLAAWQELGWWQEAARAEGAAILPVFAVLAGATAQAIETDEPRFRSSSTGSETASADALGMAGLKMISSPVRLLSMDANQEEQIKYRIKSIYEEAYGVRTRPIAASKDVQTTIRSEIRRWITLWDLQRCYPDYDSDVVTEELQHDTSQIVDESIIAEDDSAYGE